MTGKGTQGLADALRALPSPKTPDAVWQRIERSLEADPVAVHRPRAIPPPAWPRWLGLLAACCAALFLWFESIERPTAEQPRPADSDDIAQVNQNVMQLQQLSARLEQELDQRRAQSTRYDDDMALREAMLAAALEDIDVALAGAADEQRVQSLWTQRVALLAGLNEQAADPLPLGRVDWVQVN